jgi:hypothetical protein
MTAAGLSSWAGLNPVDIADLSGRVSYSGGSFLGIDQSGVALKSVSMSFQVNLAGGAGAISNGSLAIIDSKDSPWNVGFSGNLDNSSATFTNIQGDFGSGGNKIDITGDITGVFLGSSQDPDFAAGFSLGAGPLHQVQGQVLLSK